MPSHANLIADRYVSAFFALAEEKKQHDTIKKDLLALEQAVAESPELQTFLVNPVITRKASADAITAVLAALKLSALTQQFFALLAHQRRLALTTTIIEKYLMLLAKERGELIASVTSASPLSKEQAKTLSDALAKATKKKIELKLSENPALIGGVQVQIGSQMFDNSLLSKLTRLRAVLTKAA